MNIPDQYYRPMVHGPRPFVKGYPFKVSLLDHPLKATVTPQRQLVQCPWSTITALKLPIFAPVLVQMTVVHEPSLQLLQFAAHLAPLLGSALSFCAFLFGELAMLGSSLCEARKAILSLWSSGCSSVEPAAPYRQLGRPLAPRAFTRSCLTPLALPVWPI